MTSQADLGVYLHQFESISLYLLHKERLSESEQSRWFLDGFSPVFKSALLHCLSLSDLNYHPEDPWATDEILLQAKRILMAQECAPITCAEPQPPKPRIQQPAHHFCYFCRQDGHIRAQCKECTEYLQAGKCKLASGHIVLPGWLEIPRAVLGCTLKDCIDNWHALWAEAPKSGSMCAIPSLPSAPNPIPAHEPLARVLDHSGPLPPLPHLSLLTLGDELPHKVPKCSVPMWKRSCAPEIAHRSALVMLSLTWSTVFTGDDPQQRARVLIRKCQRPHVPRATPLSCIPRLVMVMHWYPSPSLY